MARERGAIDVYGRQREHSALMGWPDDHDGDGCRDGAPLADPCRRVGSEDRARAASTGRDPQEGSWGE